MTSLNSSLRFPTTSIFKDITVEKSSDGFVIKTKNEQFKINEFNPILAKVLSRLQIEHKLSNSIFGPTPPSAFVGEYGYPNVLAGPMVDVSQDTNPSLNEPSNWFSSNNQNEQTYWKIIESRSNLVRGKYSVNVKNPGKFTEQIQESAASVKPVDLEIDFLKAPKFSIYFSSVALPNGPSGTLNEFRISSNPSIPRIVDELKEDKLLTNQAVSLMLEKGHDVYYIQKLLSVGMLGKSPKMVPTKWSITASDDIVGKLLLKQVRLLDEFNEFYLYSNYAFGNNFQIILTPGSFEFEQFEAWDKNTPWGNEKSVPIEYDYEGFTGRTKYSTSEGGGYYAGRLSCLKHLLRINKQAKVTIIREINSDYLVSLGVAQVRENVAQALNSKPIKFSNSSDLFSHLSSKLSRNPNEYLFKSRILSQKRLSNWF